MWIAKDENGEVYMYVFKPIKSPDRRAWFADRSPSRAFMRVKVSNSLSSKLSWYDEEPMWIRFISPDIHLIDSAYQSEFFRILCG